MSGMAADEGHAYGNQNDGGSERHQQLHPIRSIKRTEYRCKKRARKDRTW